MASETGRAGRPGRPATLKDVAARAGVSIGTASKVLSGGYTVRPETKERVQHAAEILRFSPNRLAQSLHYDRTGTVGLLTNHLDRGFPLPVLVGAEDTFGADQVSVFLCDAHGDPLREEHHLRAMLGRRVDGLIVVGDSTKPRESLGRSLPMPVVYAYAPSDDPQDVSVTIDNVGAGHLAAEHLIDWGRRHIGYVSDDADLPATPDRVEGAAAALAAHGLTFAGGDALSGGWTEEWGRSGVRTLLTRDPRLDAVLCGSDRIARGVLDALRDDGHDVPGEIAVMGHDNWEIIATQSRPPLTTIDLNLRELGRRAAQLLCRAIDGEELHGRQAIATRLVLRGSTAPASGRS